MNGNAIIEGTMLGYENHGIMTCYLHLKQAGCGQGFGGYTLDDIPLKDAQGHCYGDRQPSVICGFWIKRILETVGVEKWEALKGQYVRVIGTSGQIEAIGHITEDKWFYPKTEIEALRESRL